MIKLKKLLGGTGRGNIWFNDRCLQSGVILLCFIQKYVMPINSEGSNVNLYRG